MSSLEKLIAAFEDAAQHDEKGNEFWFARDLQKLLEYDRWENFEATITRAQTACRVSGQTISDHFRDVTKMVELGSGAHRPIEDIRLDRYACYLITQNGDARKRPVAFGQTYFAIQTRRQELADQSGAAVPLSEDEKRVFLRNQIKEHNVKLSSAAKDAGVITPKEFAIFHSQGYLGQYRRTVADIRAYKGLPKGAEILDHMGSTELAANFFRVTQTEEKLRKDKIRGAKRAYETHYAVGREVREAMLKISGIAPEDLPAVDSIKHAERRLKGDPSPKIAPKNPVAVSAATPAVPEPPPMPASEDRRPVDLRTDLWKFALLVMATRPDGVISTSDMISELPKFIHVPEGSQAILAGRNDNKFSQIVRNLKSHKTSKSNFIFLGYAEDVPNGFKITQKGREFVKAYFSD